MIHSATEFETLGPALRYAGRHLILKAGVAALTFAVLAWAHPASAQALSYADPSAYARQDFASPDRAAEDRSSNHLQKRIVAYQTRETPGTIVVDTANTYLYYVLGNGQAIRYGIGVGREGFTWSGVQTVTRKAEWPDWVPPAEMIARQPYLPRFMAGGDGNPLGARAMYLGSSIYRIHGTNDPSTIGKFVSSGCIRLTNEDIIDLFSRVNVGTKVVVLPKSAPRIEVRSNTPRVSENVNLSSSSGTNAARAALTSRGSS